VLDDIAMRRPWNLRVKAARAWSRVRLRSLRPGVTVVIVNWNTRQVTADVLIAVQKLSPPDTKILLIDNGSTDGSREHFDGWPGIETMFLSSNAGHGVALDLGVCASRSTVTVTLDSDAIPLREGWLDLAVQPLLSGQALIAGLRATRSFVHPVFLAIDTTTFVKRKLSFQVHVESRSADSPVVWGVNGWDTGEVMERSFSGNEVRFLEPSQNAVDDLPGMTTASVVYHHGGVSRDSAGGVPEEAFAGWRSACTALGLSSVIDAHE
jgi:glycosyltransferase involved in cell wall biosynthesis